VKRTEPTYQSDQLYYECQLVAAVNAATFLGLSSVRIGTLEYERLVDFSGARTNGSFLPEIQRAHEYLQIARRSLPTTYKDISEKIMEGHPVEVYVKSTKVKKGSHSVLLVDCREYLQQVRVINSRVEKIWYEWKDFRSKIYSRRYTVHGSKVIRAYYFYKHPNFLKARQYKLEMRPLNEQSPG